jgi:hypothetical protein
VAAPTIAGPFTARSFSIFFEWNSDFLIYQYGDYLLQQAADWIALAHPRRVVITGFAATQPQVISSQHFAEPASLAQLRAQSTAESLRRLVPGVAVETAADTGGAPSDHADADTLPDQSRRRVDIRAEF